MHITPDPQWDQGWDQLTESSCATWIRGLTVEQVVHAFNGSAEDLPDAAPVTIEDEGTDTFSTQPVGARLLLRQHGPWVLALEVRTKRGYDDVTLTAVSQQGEAFCVLTGENFGTRVAHAIDGLITHTCDADDMGDPEVNDDHVREARSWAASLGVGQEAWADDGRTAALLLAEALTQTVVDDSWVREGWIGVRLLPKAPPPVGTPVILPYADIRELVGRRPDLRVFVDTPSHDHIPLMNAMLAHFAVDRVQLTDPVITEALAALDGTSGADADEMRERVHDLILRFRAEYDTEPPPDRQQVLLQLKSAAETVEAALDNNLTNSRFAAGGTGLDKEEALIADLFGVIQDHLRHNVSR